MPNQQLVPLPAGVLNAGQKFATIDLLATVGRFGAPTNASGDQLERDLAMRFASVPQIGFADAAAWLNTTDVQTQALALPGDSEALRSLLQQGNQQGWLQLLAVSDASKLVEVDDTSGPQALWSRPVACLLLRYGYSLDQDYGIYCASLPGDGDREIHLTWESVVASGVSDALSILPPVKTVTFADIADELHIIAQAQAAQAAAHASIQAKLGQQQSAAPGMTEQAV